MSDFNGEDIETSQKKSVEVAMSLEIHCKLMGSLRIHYIRIAQNLYRDEKTLHGISPISTFMKYK